jgi:hypothetical protein
MRDFMVSVSLFPSFFQMQLRKSIWASKAHSKQTSVVVNYNTITNASFILLKSEIHATSETSGLASKKYLAEGRQGGGGTACAEATALTPMFSILCPQLIVPHDFAHKFPLT